MDLRTRTLRLCVNHNHKTHKGVILVGSSMATDFFYTELKSHEGTFEDILSNRRNFSVIPDDWHVIVTDIVDSTVEYMDGKYQEINIVAASTIITVINVARKYGIEIPFVYGGDGATMMVPTKILDESLRALVAIKNNAERRFKINLRVGSVPVSYISKHGFEIKVAKFFIAEGYPQALFIDSGLYFAEEMIKRSDKHFLTHKRAAKIPLQLDGLKCRWDEIPPPSGYSEVVCLIVLAHDFKTHEKTYRDVLRHIHDTYGDFMTRHPINIDAMMQNIRLKALVRESYAKLGRLDAMYVATHAVGALFQSLKNQKKFREKNLDFVMSATDTLKVDGKLCTIIAGIPEQRTALLKYLEQEEARGRLVFGYSVAPSTTITCLIRERTNDYINFIDGTGGGYIQAAAMIKIKLGKTLED